MDTHSNHENGNGGGGRDYISSPGYDTSSSTAPASSPDPCEYTYEGAIQDYKSRVSRASSGAITSSVTTGSTVYSSSNFYAASSKDSTPERTAPPPPPPKRPLSTAIESRLLNFETTKETADADVIKKELPKVDIGKRRELFEKETTPAADGSDKAVARLSSDFSNSISIRERLSNLEKRDEIKDAAIKKLNRLSGEEFGSSVKDRLTNIERDPFVAVVTAADKPIIDVPIVALKDRLSNLQLGNVKLADDADYTRGGGVEEQQQPPPPKVSLFIDEIVVETVGGGGSGGEEDSGIHTADVSCAVSQNEEETVEMPDVVPTMNKVVAAVEAVEELIEDVAADAEQETSVSCESISITIRDGSKDGCTTDGTNGINQTVVEVDIIANKSNPVASSRNVVVNNRRLIPSELAKLKSGLSDEVVATTSVVSSHVETADLKSFNEIAGHNGVATTSPTSHNYDAVSSATELINKPLIIPSDLSQLAPVSKLSGDAAVQATVESPSIIPTNELSGHNEVVDSSLVDAPKIPFEGNTSHCDVITTSKPKIAEKPSFETIDAKNQRLKCQIVGVLEKNKQFVAAAAADVCDAPLSLVTTAPLSPASSTRSSSTCSSKSSTKNIFDFIKLNLLNETNDNLLEKSTFYVALTEHEQDQRRADAMLAKGDSFESNSSELNRMLDEELNKLN